MHLANNRVSCPGCSSSQIKRRPVSVRCGILADAVQQRLHRKRSHACTVSCSAATQAQPRMGADQSKPSDTAPNVHETDFVVIGSGIGGMLQDQTDQCSLCSPLQAGLMPKRTCAGLCCAAMLARYGYEVTVCESHYALGGAAHSFEVKGHHFDSGPSFFAGLSGELQMLVSCLLHLARTRLTPTSQVGSQMLLHLTKQLGTAMCQAYCTKQAARQP